MKGTRDYRMLDITEQVCLFCGRNKESKWDEHSNYYKCDCEDARKEREIEAKIRDLKSQLPKNRFEIRQSNILMKIEK